MKLLGWMHRKFRQNSTEPFKDLVIGQPSPDDEHNNDKPNPVIKHFKQTQKDHNLRKSFAGLEAAREDDTDTYEEESPTDIYDLFHGFLAIGTLGSEQIVTDPSSTPTFGCISVESITEKEDEVTENELKLINDELEKVLVAETKDDGISSHDSSSRNSHVSNGRSSHGSIITLSGKTIEGRESNGSGTAIFPLQGYLFGSAIELSETTEVAKKHRTSLGELFQISKLAEENCGAKFEKEEKITEREAEKSPMHLMRKKLSKRMIHASSRSSTTISGGPVDSASAETKLHKILHMFRRKVHPESSAAAKKSLKQKKNENKKKVINDGGHNKGDLVHPEESMQPCKSQSNPLEFPFGSEDSFGNREHWIKTDADYLVLEL